VLAPAAAPPDAVIPGGGDVGRGQARPIAHFHEFDRDVRVLRLETAGTFAAVKVFPPTRCPSEGIPPSLRREGLEARTRYRQVGHDRQERGQPCFWIPVLMIENHLAGKAAGRQLDLQQPESCGTHSDVVPFSEPSELANVAL